MTTVTQRSTARRPWRRRNTTQEAPSLGVVRDVRTPVGPYLFIITALAALCLIGLVFVLSASSVSASQTQSTSWYFFVRQLFFVAVGTAAAWIARRVDYHRWVRMGPAAMVLTLAALALVLVPNPLSHVVNGSARWLGPSSLQFQPSEVAKLALILWLAGFLQWRRNDLREWRLTILPAFVMLGAVGALVLVEPDLGTVALMSGVVVAMLVVAGCRLDVIALSSVPLLAVGLGASLWSYRGARMLAFLDPWKHASTTGFQTLQSQVGLASGGLFGVGIGNSRAKWGFLPEAHTDFIFSIIGEETGLFGCLIVIGLFVGLVWAGIKVGRQARDLSGLLVATGISTWIGLQALFNIGVAVGVLPNKGITLPFVSYGGSSLVVTMFAAGILLNVASRTTSVVSDRSQGTARRARR